MSTLGRLRYLWHNLLIYRTQILIVNSSISVAVILTPFWGPSDVRLNIDCIRHENLIFLKIEPTNLFSLKMFCLNLRSRNKCNKKELIELSDHWQKDLEFCHFVSIFYSPLKILEVVVVECEFSVILLSKCFPSVLDLDQVEEFSLKVFYSFDVNFILFQQTHTRIPHTWKPSILILRNYDIKLSKCIKNIYPS